MKIGLCAWFRLDVGGGAPRLTVDLINTLNKLEHEVYLVTPFKLDYKEITRIYEPIKIKKIYHLNKLRGFFCGDFTLTRKLLKKQFQKMAKGVDLIIDIDGGILHNYLPKNFDKSKYIVWRFAAIDDQKNIKTKQITKRGIKKLIKKILFLKQTKSRHAISKTHKIYAIDEWTRKRLINNRKLKPEKIILYPCVHTEEFALKKRKKKNQIVVLGRFAGHKMIEDSIKIFSYGIKEHPNYKLIILGGITSDSKEYLKYLKKIINKLDITKKVKIIKQPPFNTIKKVLADSKILIHSQQDTSLTMTAIESMAAGCIVLAHKSTGTYLEVLSKGEYGYGFGSTYQGAKKLNKILNELKQGKINNKKSIKRAEFFSQKEFRERVRRIINKKL